MNQTINHARTTRLLTTRVMATLWLAGAAGGFAADTPAATNKTAVVAGDVAVLVDDASLWRHFHLVGPCTFLTATGGGLGTGLPSRRVACKPAILQAPSGSSPSSAARRGRRRPTSCVALFHWQTLRRKLSVIGVGALRG